MNQALIRCLVLLILSPTLLLAVVHSAVDPAPRGDGWWKDRHSLINQRAREAGKSAQVIFIGDSITQGWEGEGQKAWERYYKHRQAVNLGIGGDRTQHVLWRLDNGNIDGLEPKVAVVMIGTNNSNGEDNTPGQIADGIEAIVGKLRAKLPRTRILLLAIFPRGENFSAQRGKLAQINQVIRRLADDKHVFWADIGHHFLTNDGVIPKNLMPDFLHLSPAGYDIWASAIESTLVRLIGDKPMAAASIAGTAGKQLSGTWLFNIRGPEGNPVESDMLIEVEGDVIRGRLQRGPGSDQWLTIDEGERKGDRVSWSVTRERSDGGRMKYVMSGEWNGDSMKGKARTQVKGEDVTVDWSARRKL